MSLSKEDRAGVAAGATVLIGSNFIVKIIGLIYKIPLVNIIGREGMGYFSSALEIYTLILTIFVSGGSVAVSKMIAESYALGRYREVRKVMLLMTAMFLFIGAAGTYVMYFGSRQFAVSVGNELATLSVIALSPAIFFLALSTVLRGYFQGLGNMRPTGVSQVVEALFKLLVGIGAALILKKFAYSSDIVSAGAISGTTVSTIIGALIMMFFYFSSRRRKELNALAAQGGECDTTKKLLSSFLKIVIPLTLSSVVVNLTGVLDLFLIFNRLKSIGLDEKAANIAYGGYKGYAQTLFNLPPSIISSINISIIPAISAAFVVKNFKRTRYVVNRSVKIVVIMALPCAVGLMVLAGPIQRLLFTASQEEINSVTPLLIVLGFASFCTSLSTLTTAILQSSGKMNYPVISLIVGGAVKLATNYVLVGIKSIGIMGAPIGTTLCYAVMTAMNFAYMRKVLPFKVPLIRLTIKPLFAGLAMGFFAYYSQMMLASVLGDRLATILSIILAAGVYGLVLLLVGGIKESDVMLLPKGATIVRILKKLHLIAANA